MLLAKSARIHLMLFVVMAVYFIASTEIFQFGRNTPIFWYSEYQRGNYYQILLYIFFVYFALFSGGFISQLLLGRRRRVGRFEFSRHNAFGRMKARGLSAQNVLAALVSASPLVFIFLAIDLDEFLSRSHSFDPDYSNPRMMVFADLLFWFAAIAIPFVTPRWLSLALLFANVTAFSGLGERQAVVALFLYVFIRVIFIRDGKYLLDAILLVFSVYLLTVLIGVRAVQVGGLLVVLQVLWSPSEFLGDGAASYAINYMLNFSLIVNAVAIEDGRHFPMDLVIYGLSPLPSFFYDRSDDFYEMTRILPYVPFPGFSMLILSFGILGLVIAAFFFGFLLHAFLRIYCNLVGIFDLPLYLILIYAPFLFSLQYNLRAASRIFFIALAVYFVYQFYILALARRQT